MCVFLSNLAAISYMRIWFRIEKDWISNNSCRAWSSVGLETGCRRPFEIPRHTLMQLSFAPHGSSVPLSLYFSVRWRLNTGHGSITFSHGAQSLCSCFSKSLCTQTDSPSWISSTNTWVSPLRWENYYACNQALTIAKKKTGQLILLIFAELKT